MKERQRERNLRKKDRRRTWEKICQEWTFTFYTHQGGKGCVNCTHVIYFKLVNHQSLLCKLTSFAFSYCYIFKRMLIKILSRQQDVMYERVFTLPDFLSAIDQTYHLWTTTISSNAAATTLISFQRSSPIDWILQIRILMFESKEK